MRSDREKLLPWLIQRIESGQVPGLYWWDKCKTQFRVTWKHAGKPDFNLDQDAVLFRMWAEHTGKYKPGEQPDPSTWKTRFRCALRKQPDIVEIPITNSLDETEPFRVFLIKNRVIRPSKTSRSSSVSPANTPSTSPDDVMEMFSYNSTVCAKDTVLYEIPFSSTDSSPTSSPRSSAEITEQTMSLDDDDLDNITPTLPLLCTSRSDTNMTFFQSDSQMMLTDSSYGYAEPIRTDSLEYRDYVRYDMFDGMTPATNQIPDSSTYNFGIQEQNEMAAHLGVLMALQELLFQNQQAPIVNHSSSTAQTYRNFSGLNTM